MITVKTTLAIIVGHHWSLQLLLAVYVMAHNMCVNEL